MRRMASANDTMTSPMPARLRTDARAYGRIIKSPTEKHTEKMTVNVMAIFHSLASLASSRGSSVSSSSSAANSADHMSDDVPTTSESINATAPRRIGILWIPLTGHILLYGSSLTSI